MWRRNRILLFCRSPLHQNWAQVQQRTGLLQWPRRIARNLSWKLSRPWQSKHQSNQEKQTMHQFWRFRGRRWNGQNGTRFQQTGFESQWGPKWGEPGPTPSTDSTTLECTLCWRWTKFLKIGHTRGRFKHEKCCMLFVACHYSSIQLLDKSCINSQIRSPPFKRWKWLFWYNILSGSWLQRIFRAKLWSNCAECVESM